MINSTLKGPIEGTDLPAASKHNGEKEIKKNMKSFLLYITKRDLSKYFIYPRLEH